MSACTTSQQTNDAIAGAHYPAGYTDGCATAREVDDNFSTKVIQDESLFEVDEGYRSGWRQGFLACRNQNSDTDDTTNMGVRRNAN